MEGWAALVLRGLSRREGSRVDGHAGEIGRLPAREEGFVRVFKTPDQLEVANNILLHGRDCTRVSVSIGAHQERLTVAPDVALLVGVNVDDEVRQVEAPLNPHQPSAGHV